MAARTRRRSSTAGFVVGAIVVATLYFAQEVLVPVALAALVSFLLAPAASWLERRGLGRVPSVLAVVLLAAALVGGLAYTVGDQVVRLAKDLPKYQDEILAKRNRLMNTGGSLGENLEKFGDAMSSSAQQPATRPTTGPADEIEQARDGGVVGDAIDQVAPDPIAAAGKEATGGPPANVEPTASPGLSAENPLYTVALPAPVSPVRTLASYLGFVLGPIGTAGLVIVFVIFVLLERDGMRDRLIRLTSRGRYTVTTRALDDAANRIGKYLLAQSIVNGSYGLVISIGLFIIGLALGHGTGFPSFVLWGVLCAVLRFIPYVGPWVGAAFPILLSLAVYPGFEVFAATLGLFVVVELLSNNVMEPWLYGSTTGLSTVALLVAAVFWTWLWGPVGLLLSTPLTVCLVVLGKHVPQLKFLDVLLGDTPPLPPGVRFYQRLLAEDEHEAKDVLEDAVEEREVQSVSDDIVVPALRLLRRDRKNGDLSPGDENRVLDDMADLVVPAELKADDDPDSEDNVPAGPLVLAVPSHHRAEEVALRAMQAATVLDGFKLEAIGTRGGPAEVETRVERDRPAVVVIAVLPPGGLPQARYLCKRLRGRFPELRIVVCYLGRTRQFDKLLVNLRDAGASYVNTSIEQTRSQVRALVGHDLGATRAEPTAGVNPE